MIETISFHTLVSEILAPRHAWCFSQDDKNSIIHHRPSIHSSIYPSLQQILLSATPASHWWAMGINGEKARAVSASPGLTPAAVQILNNYT